MPSNLDFDPHLLEEAQKLGGFKYKKEAVNAALKEFIAKRKQMKIIELFDSIEYDAHYDHKKGRMR